MKCMAHVFADHIVCQFYDNTFNVACKYARRLLRFEDHVLVLFLIYQYHPMRHSKKATVHFLAQNSFAGKLFEAHFPSHTT